MSPIAEILSGTSGLVLPLRNKSEFPAGFRNTSRLTYYASLFNSIEINSSFYKVPLGKTIGRWATEVPAGFRFTFKVWREITHNRNLVFEAADIAHFVLAVREAGEKNACLLLQLPASTHADSAPQLFRLLDLFKKYLAGAPCDLAVEFRNLSWYRDDIVDMLLEFEASVVIHDKSGSQRLIAASGSPVAYLRFHGPSGDYRGSYDDGFLHEYAQYASEWQKEGRRVYVYFNNTLGRAVFNLAAFNGFLAGE